VHPKTFVAVKFTVGVIEEEVEFTYVKLGLVATDVAVGVTPKFQRYVIAPVDVFVKLTFKGEHPDTGLRVKVVVGNTFTVNGNESESLQKAELTTNFTVYVPAAV